MKFMKGDMLRDCFADVILVTTNCIVRKDGALVMGRGAAYQAKSIWPDFQYRLGETIKNIENFDKNPEKKMYGTIVLPNVHLNRHWGAFQVKYHWADEADLNLIGYSKDKLCELASMLPNWTFAVNFPGIGNGRLTRDDVLEELTNDYHLADPESYNIEEFNNIEIWEYA